MSLAVSRAWPATRIFLIGMFLLFGYAAYAKGVRKGTKEEGGNTIGTAFFAIVLIVLPMLYLVYITRKSAAKNGNGSANKAP